MDGGCARFLVGTWVLQLTFLSVGSTVCRTPVSLGCGSPRRTRQAPKPREQRGEMRRVLFRHGREFQSQSLVRLTMPHDGLGPDLAFLDEKIEPGFRAYRPWAHGSYEQTSRAQVPDAGDVLDPVTTPIDPNSVWRLDPRGMAPRIRRCLRREHKAP